MTHHIATARGARGKGLRGRKAKQRKADLGAQLRLGRTGRHAARERAGMTLRPVPVARLTWPCHDLDPSHHHPEADSDLVLETGPLRVEELADGSLFVHDGRHRAIRAQARGDDFVLAYVLERDPAAGAERSESSASESDDPRTKPVPRAATARPDRCRP